MLPKTATPRGARLTSPRLKRSFLIGALPLVADGSTVTACGQLGLSPPMGQLATMILPCFILAIPVAAAISFVSGVMNLPDRELAPDELTTPLLRAKSDKRAQRKIASVGISLLAAAGAAWRRKRPHQANCAGRVDTTEHRTLHAEHAPPAATNSTPATGHRNSRRAGKNTPPPATSPASSQRSPVKS